MHIKQVTIEGFKSYREQTIADPFSPKINLIVGANGSGKSNFFHAIRFVLADLFTSLRQEERVALLHESTGPAVQSAYVEILFDNSDKRLPVDRDEVRLKRVISAKKDEYFIDKKHVSKKEVADMLESAGFSKANPYYVVQQGKIMQMAKMTDEARLNLLKEIGGAGTYEERRKESMKYLQETEAKTVQIDEMLADMNAKLAELEAERKELEEYHDADRTRRCTEYALLDQEKTKAQADLVEIDELTARAKEERQQKEGQAAAAAGELERLGDAIQGAEQRIEEAAKLKDAAQEQLTKAIEGSVAATALRKELQAKILDDNYTREHKQLEVDQTRELIRKTEADLQRVKDQEAEASRAETELNHEIQTKDRRQTELINKQGARQQFSSKAERDKWIKDDIQKQQNLIKQSKAKQQKAEQEAEQFDKRIEALRQQKADLQERLKATEANLAEKEAAQREADQEHLTLTQKKTEMWREADALKTEIKRLIAERDALDNEVNKAMPRDVNKGIFNVRKWVAERRIPGVHGAVFELFSIKNSNLNTVVEIVAGNMLNFVVVDEADTATMLSRMLFKAKGGRVTFLPLDTIEVPNLNPPKTNDAVPLSRHLVASNPTYQKVVDYVFGRTLLCRNMQMAREYSEDRKFDCVTIEGGKFSRQGTVSGGGNEPNRKGKLTLLNQARKVNADLDQKQQEQAELERQTNDLEQQILNAQNKKFKVGQEKHEARGDLSSIRREIQDVEDDIKRLQQQKEKCMQSVTRYKEQIEEFEAEVTSKTALLNTPFNTQLTKEEVAELKALPKDLHDLKQKLTKEQDKHSRLKRRITSLESEVDEMKSRVATLQQELDEALQATGDADVQAAAQAETVAKQGEDAARARVQELGKQMNNLKKEVNELIRQKTQYEEVIESVGDASQHTRHLEDLAQQKVALNEQLNDLQKKMRDLGSLPSDAYQKYKGKSAKELKRALTRAQQQLSALSHVNKKALNQYTLFMEQREDVLKRRKQQEEDGNKIRELIEVLDRRKYEALQRTVKGVGVHFQEVFAALVPGGKGTLRIVTAANEEGADKSGSASNRVEQVFTGVKVKVSFGAGETMSMHILSGGQKTLVALALILAIQRCDPAPFYLFDEIDAALDPHYRTTVAEMLRRQADDRDNPCQFIITTFNTQLVQHADKIYGVSQRNRISNVDVITKDAAMQFLALEDQGNNQQQQGSEQANGGGPAAGPSGQRDKRKRRDAA